MVVLLGPDRDLLKAALTNLAQGKRGLADAKALAGAAAHANPARRAEVHVSVAEARAWLDGADLEVPKPALTSFALTADPDFLQLDVWVPPSEAKAIERSVRP